MRSSLFKSRSSRDVFHPLAGRLRVFTVLVLILGLFPSILLVTPVAAAGTTSVTVTKYDAHGNVIGGPVAVTWEQMRDGYMNLPVYGDGNIHYYCEGPNFDEARTFETLWDPTETGNIDSRDYGAAMGTDVKDLCELVGGMEPGDTVATKAVDGWNRTWDYENIYTPDPRFGRLVITWYTKDAEETTDGYVPDGYATGMRLLFFTEITDSSGRRVFGDYDAHETMPENRWYYYSDGRYWPTTSGMSGKYIDRIEIHQPKLISCDASGIAKESFIPGETVYVKGVGLTANAAYNLWVQPEPVVWISNARGDTVPGATPPVPMNAAIDPSGMQESVTTDASGDFDPAAVWTIDFSAAAKKYDVVADAQAAGTVGTFDTADGVDSPGFQGFEVIGTSAQEEVPSWDLNADHTCNLADIQIIGLQWGETGAGGWIKEDVNRDGIINISDVVTLGLHFGETW